MISSAMPRAQRIAACLRVGSVALLLAVTGCGGKTGPGSATGKVTSITVLDYYTDDPEHTQWGDLLTACGKTHAA